VLYVSDHGEMLGNHGLWTKMVMYEDSAAIPMILSGPGVPEGRVVGTACSLVDVFPTVLDCVGLAAGDDDRPGRSLFEIADGADADRIAFSEYHDGGSVTGFFMVRLGRWKYVHYAAGYAPQLFDLEVDPDETRDLGSDPGHAGVRDECRAALGTVVDPEEANARAFADQARRLAALGGRDAALAARTFDWTPLPEG
jgi:choline-sulfatase